MAELLMGNGRKHTPEQISNLMRQIDSSVANGKTSAAACKECGITVQTYYRWRREYSNLKPDQSKRLKELEQENEKLKRLVAELSLEKQILRDITRGNL
jgi:putative transposase